MSFIKIGLISYIYTCTCIYNILSKMQNSDRVRYEIRPIFYFGELDVVDTFLLSSSAESGVLDASPGVVGGERR